MPTKLKRIHGWQLVAARGAAGQTVREFAERSGVTAVTITKLEKMNTVDIANGYRLPGKADRTTIDKMLEAANKDGIRVRVTADKVIVSKEH